jgi:hypothetical protein
MNHRKHLFGYVKKGTHPEAVDDSVYYWIRDLGCVDTGHREPWFGLAWI